MSTPDNWREKAACRGMPPDMFILDRGVPSEPGRRVCATCTVRGPCDQFAVDNQENGIWGGRVHKINLTKKPKDISPTPIEDMRPRPRKAQ